MKKLSISIPLSGGAVDLVLFQKGKKRWVELPALKLEEDSDCCELHDLLGSVFLFLEGEAEIEDYAD